MHYMNMLPFEPFDAIFRRFGPAAAIQNSCFNLAFHNFQWREALSSNPTRRRVRKRVKNTTSMLREDRGRLSRRVANTKRRRRNTQRNRGRQKDKGKEEWAERKKERIKEKENIEKKPKHRLCAFLNPPPFLPSGHSPTSSKIWKAIEPIEDIKVGLQKKDKKSRRHVHQSIKSYTFRNLSIYFVYSRDTTEGRSPVWPGK